MKKILIMFIGLILGCNLVSAKSVSCWEEIDATFKGQKLTAGKNTFIEKDEI